MSQLKDVVTMSEFVGWLAYFDRRRRTHDKDDWRTASIVAAVYNSQGGKTKISDHLLQFQEPVAQKRAEENYDSKNIWLALMGINLPET